MNTFLTDEPDAAIDTPILLIGRGGSGTRLLSELVRQLGVFLGNRLNETGDSVEWVDLVYAMAIDLVPRGGDEDLSAWRDELRDRAACVLRGGGWRPRSPWGLKLPETILVLPELLHAFPGAKVIHLVRNPLATCLRRTHMTSRLDNPVGQAVLRAAYRELGWDHDPARDPDHIRNAASWRYQLGEALRASSRLEACTLLQVDFDLLCDATEAQSRRVANFLDVAAQPVRLRIEPDRRQTWSAADPRAAEVWQVCEPVARAFGFGPA